MMKSGSSLMTVPIAAEFATRLVAWQKQDGRQDLPWQQSKDAYRVWLSEIMLQQTQVSTVIPYYQRFLQHFPTVQDLAQAPADAVMALWAGLGYYTRARNLHACAKQVVSDYQGHFPERPALLQELPGIGRSTAAAIAAFAYNQRAAILDGNVKRVLTRVFGIEDYPGKKAVEDQLWDLAESLLPEREIDRYTQGLMDLGATVCTRNKPHCARCPFQDHCFALAQDRTADIPVRKPKQASKEKHAVMFLIQCQDQVLLEQRPERGIWGGLLSFPELQGMREGRLTTNQDGLLVDPAGLAQHPQVQAFIGQFGVSTQIHSLPPVVHVFTHFKLHIHVVHARLRQRAYLAAERPWQWYASTQFSTLALPAPIKTLLLACV